MTELDYFGLQGAEELFKEVQTAISEYSQQPSERRFLFLVFSLNHLREWIAGASYKQLINKKDKNLPLSDGELFFFEIWSLNEFQIISSLCNRGKHCLTRNIGLETSRTKGFNCSTGKVSDSFDQEYFLIDGVDSRDIFFPMVRRYYLWFNKDG